MHNFSESGRTMVVVCFFFFLEPLLRATELLENFLSFDLEATPSAEFEKTISHPQAKILERVAFPSSRGSSLAQESSSCLLHWQTDSLLLSHWGSLANTRQTNSEAATVRMHTLVFLEK